VTNQGGSATTVRSIAVPAGVPPPVCAKPTPNFTWTTTGSGSNTVYSYVDASTVADAVNCPITDWAWTFTDGGLQSNFKKPTPFSYNNNSTHSVTLTVTNPGGSSSITKDS
jgi:PKD repeat protein